MARDGKWTDDDGAHEGACESCGEIDMIKSCEDPFAREINNTEVGMGCVCFGCWLVRKEDI